MSRSFISNFSLGLKRIFGPALSVLGRTGKIAQILFDAAQIQRFQDAQYRAIGRLTRDLVKEGKIHNLAIERMVAKIDQAERILKRHDELLIGYQKRGDVRKILKTEDLKQIQSVDDSWDAV